jgi:CheY-like chemotaxis protein/HPt (histidine-containing phosphotransfer) domain-containing protein
VAKTGPEAVAAVARNDFDVVLADLRLPGMDGFEATRQMLALAKSRGCSLPVIAVTANLMAEDIAACRQAGMVAVVGKPVDPRRLAAALADAVAGRSEFPADVGANHDSDIEPLFSSEILGQAREALGAAEVERLVKIGRQAIGEHLYLLRVQSEAGHWDAVAATAHKLAGAAGSYGLVHLRNGARRIETAVRGGENEPVTAVVAELDNAFRRGMAELERWLATSDGESSASSEGAISA